MSESNLKLAALYTIFEKHLYDFEDNEESEEAFIKKIVDDYIQFLTESQVVVPRRWETVIRDELRDQVRNMLVKKMYGCLSVKEFLHGQQDRADKRRHSRKRYSRMRRSG